MNMTQLFERIPMNTVDDKQQQLIDIFMKSNHEAEVALGNITVYNLVDENSIEEGE